MLHEQDARAGVTQIHGRGIKQATVDCTGLEVLTAVVMLGCWSQLTVDRNMLLTSSW
jgi:hypothetical protein